MVNQKRIETAIAEQATFAMLAAFYNTNPDEAFLRTVSQLNPAEIEDEEVKNIVEQILDGTSEPLLELKRDWTKLFRGVAPDYGPMPPYVQQYIDERKLDMISELAALYVKYNFTGLSQCYERHDYIGVLLDFAAYFSGLRAGAEKSGNEAEYMELTEIFEDFIRKYISSWFGRFCNEAEKYASTKFYKNVLKLTALMI